MERERGKLSKIRERRRQLKSEEEREEGFRGRTRTRTRGKMMVAVAVAMDRHGSCTPSPSSSYDVVSFAEESRLSYQDRVAKIVVEQWMWFAVVRRAERHYGASLKRRALAGMVENRSKGRTLTRLALVHYASVTYGKFVAKSFAEWRRATGSGRRVRHAYMRVLTRRAILYTRSCLLHWRRWAGEQKESHLLAAFEAWSAKSQAASEEDEERLRRFRLDRDRAVLGRWRDRARESRALRAKVKQMHDLRCKSTLRAWSQKARDRATSEADRLRKHLALRLWATVRRFREERRRKLASLARQWRQKRCHRAFASWKSSWLAAKDWAVQKELATAHYVATISGMCLREWRKYCEVLAWAEMKDAERARTNAHAMVRAWRDLSFRSSDLERRRRIIVSRSYTSRLSRCFEALRIYAEVAKANVSRVVEAYAIVERRALGASFRAWQGAYVPMMRRKRAAEAMARDFAKKCALGLVFRHWIALSGLRALERATRERAKAKLSMRAFRVWQEAYQGLKAKEQEDLERGRALQRIVGAKLAARVLASWHHHAKMKTAIRLTIDLALLKQRRRILSECIRKAWVPHVEKRRVKKAKIASAEAVRSKTLARLSIVCLRAHVTKRKGKRAALRRARDYYLVHLVKKAHRLWTEWLGECKQRKKDERDAIQKFWKTSATNGIQKLMEVGLWRHRSRLRALAAVNARKQSEGWSWWSRLRGCGGRKPGGLHLPWRSPGAGTPSAFSLDRSRPPPPPRGAPPSASTPIACIASLWRMPKLRWASSQCSWTARGGTTTL